MSETAELATPAAVQTAEVETKKPETSEAPEVVEQTPEPFKAWKKPASEEPKEQHIPYSRFKEVNDERKTYAAKLDEYEAQLAEYRAREQRIEEIKDPDDINIDDYPNDPQGYLKARDNALLHKAEKTWERKQLDEARARTAQDHLNTMAQNYAKNLQESFTRNPEIEEASRYLDTIAKQIHPSIAYELMIDENIGELSYDIATDQTLLDEMLAASKGNPTDFIRKLHKMSAKIDRAVRYATNDGNTSTPLSAPKALDRKAQIMESIPARIKATSASPTKDLGKMSPSEYRKHMNALERKH